MNLAKNGTVLLAALSVLALASCGGNKESTMTYEEAKKWVEQHYTTTEEKSEVTKSNLKWNYTKNVVGKDKMPEDARLGELSGQDLNGITAYTLAKTFKANKEKAKVSENECEVVGTPTYIFDETKPMNLDNFAKEFDDEDERFEFEFLIKDNKLVIRQTYTQSRDITTTNEGSYVHFHEVDNYYFDEKGYISYANYHMSNPDQIIDVRPLAEKPLHVGNFDLSIDLIPQFTA